MDIENLVTILREEIEKIGYKCYSPDLPHNDEKCIAISLGQGTHQRSNNVDILYSDIPFYLLIRGDLDDTEIRRMADSVFNQLDHKENIKKNSVRIILISCSTPNYAFRDENQRIHYNINATVKVAWKETI